MTKLDEKLSALGCPYPHSDIQSSFWLLQHAHDNDLFKHSRELCDRFPELLKREAGSAQKAPATIRHD
jgi:hypothetical protein